MVLYELLLFVITAFGGSDSETEYQCEDTPTDLKCGLAAQSATCRISCNVARQCKGTCVALGYNCGDMMLREFALCPVEVVTTTPAPMVPDSVIPPPAPQQLPPDVQLPSYGGDRMICCAKSGFIDHQYDCSSSFIPSECASILDQICEWSEIEACHMLHGYL